MKFIIIVSLLAIGFWLAQKKRKKPKESADIKPITAKNNFKAVSIKAGKDACNAGKKVAGQRFLLGETPNTPLNKCNHIECHCKYIHHNDRRAVAEDRRSVYSTKTQLFQESDDLNHRKSVGRRVTDKAA